MQHALPLTEQTIAARLERLPYSRWHVRITVILGVAIFFDSFDSLAIAYLWASSYIISYSLQGWIPTLYREIYHLTLQQSLNYAVAAPLGSVLGSLICVFLIDRIGRRYCRTRCLRRFAFLAIVRCHE